MKLCVDAICKPLETIFDRALMSGSCPSEWKKANVLPTSNNLWSYIKLLADDKFLFSVVHDINVSDGELNEEKISDLAFQWKMMFNPNASKQAQNVILTQKLNEPLIVSQTNSQKHLELL